MKRLLIPAFCFLLSAWSLLATDVLFPMQDSVGRILTNRTIVMKPTATPRVSGGVVVNDFYSFNMGTNTSVTVSNVVPSSYRVTLTGQGAATWFDVVIPDTNVVVNITNCLAAGVPDVSSVVGYTRAQVDAAIRAATNGLGSGSGNADFGLLTNNIYYVSASLGSDDTGDGTVNNPWLTPTNAISQVTNGLIYVDSGQYQFEIGGRDNVHWQLASDCVLGSTNILAGPIFEATNGVQFSVSGLGSIYATNIALRTSGTGEITLNGALVNPAVNLTNNVTGHWREP